MREIKFRGIDTMTGQWRFGDLVHNMKVTLTGVEPRVMVGGYEVKPETVGQFTGIRDKEGIEIFEGDIVEYEDILHGVFHTHLTVAWHESFHNLMLRNGCLTVNLLICNGRCKVVGNLHQRKEECP